MKIEREILRTPHVTVGIPSELTVPGLFVTRPVSQVEAFADLSDAEVRAFARTERHLRIGLKTINVAIAGLYIEERRNTPVTGLTIPFHIDRLEERFDVGVYQPHIEAYLSSYNEADTPKQEMMADAIAQYFADNADADEATGLHEHREYVEHEGVAPHLYKVLDVDDESEIPPAPEGLKYYVCLGGSKNFQAFLSEDGLSKGEFLGLFGDVLDETLQPVYEDDTLFVRQDAKYAVPGFYIVSPKEHFRSIDEMPQDVFDHSLLTMRRIKQNLASLGIANSHIYHDEKYRSPASAHFWALPLHEQPNGQQLELTIHSRDIWTYLDTYPRFSETGDTIAQCNRDMRQHLKSTSA